MIRYDGYAIKMYRQANGIRSNKITAIYEDKSGQIWVRTRRAGLYLYDSEQEQFINFSHDENDPNSLSNNIVYCILEDDKGRIWIGTENGLNLYKPKTQQFTHFKYEANNATSISSNFVGSLEQMDDGSIWIGTRLGINRMVENGKIEFKRYYFGNEDELLFSDISTNNSIDKEVLDENFVYKIRKADFQKNTLWIGTKGGLRKVTFNPKDRNEISFKTFRKNNSKSSLSSNYVRDLII